MFGTERGVAGEEDVNDDAQRPEVDGFGVAGRRAGVTRAGENLTDGALARIREDKREKGTERGIRAFRRRWSYVWWWG